MNKISKKHDLQKKLITKQSSIIQVRKLSNQYFFCVIYILVCMNLCLAVFSYGKHTNHTDVWSSLSAHECVLDVSGHPMR